MTDPTAVLEQSDAYMWQQMQKRISMLEQKSLDNVPTGAIHQFAGPLRTPFWSDTRLNAVADQYDLYYRLNEIQFPLSDIDGIMARQIASAAGLSLGQPGLLSSEGSYSAQCAHGAGAAIGPVVATAGRAWTLEAIFRLDSLPQSGLILHNGLASTNGYGISVGDPAGGPGSSLLLYIAPAFLIDTGAILFPELHYDAILVSDDADNNLHWYLAWFDPIARSYGTSSGVVATGAAVVPTTESQFGDFNGRLDEVIIFDGKVPSAIARNSAQDRQACALEPAPPSGWLKCDGTVVSRQKYAQLFSRIGTTSGAGDGSTTFQIPTIANSMIKA
jgi:hypothetical protein